MTSPTKERTKKRGTVSSSPAAVRKTKRSNTLDDKCLERSRKGKHLNNDRLGFKESGVLRRCGSETLRFEREMRDITFI